MQFSVMRTYAASRFRDVGLQVVVDADWKNYVNDAYHQMLVSVPLFPWNELSTSLTVPGNVSLVYPLNRSVSLPLDCWSVLAVWDITDQFPLVPLEGRDQVYNEYPQQIEVGQAMHYRIFNNTLQVYPAPQVATTYLVEYIAKPVDLAADSDVPIVPLAYHTDIVAGAVALAYEDDGDSSQAALYRAKFDLGIQRLTADINQARQSRYYEPVDTFM